MLRRDLRDYLIHLSKRWVLLVILVADLVGVIVIGWNPEFALALWVAWLFAAGLFVWANFQMYRDLKAQIPQGTIGRARDALNSLDGGQRQAAIATLAELRGHEAHETLVEASRHPARDVRIRAALALGSQYEPRAFEALLEAVASSDTGQRHQAVKTFAAWAPLLQPVERARAAKTLSRKIERELDDDTVTIVDALDKLDHREGVPGLIAGLKASATQRQATLALGRLGGDRALDALVSFLKVLGDSEGEMRTVVVDSLRRFGARAVDTLIDYAVNNTYELGQPAWRALESMPEAIPPLIECLLGSDISRARVAGRLLEQHRDTEVTDSLLKALHHQYSLVRRVAAEALQGRPEAVPALTVMLSADEPAQRRLAAIAVRRTNESEPVEKLAQLAVKAEDPETQTEAVHSLAASNTKRALDVLLAILSTFYVTDDKDQRVIRAVAEELGRLDDPRVVPALAGVLKTRPRRWQSFRSFVVGVLRGIGTPDAKEAVGRWSGN